MVYDILQEPHPLLRRVSEAVLSVDAAIVEILHNLRETMYAAGGIGLAAPQVGIAKRLVVMDVPAENELTEDEGGGKRSKAPREKNVVYMVNPQISWVSETMVPYVEDCLSVPLTNKDGMNMPIFRPQACRVSYLDERGAPQERLCQGLEATCVQHEIDHLDGILYIDHFSSLRRDQVKRKLKRLQRG